MKQGLPVKVMHSMTTESEHENSIFKTIFKMAKSLGKMVDTIHPLSYLTYKLYLKKETKNSLDYFCLHLLNKVNKHISRW
jgi:hypothetical protein